MGQAYEEYYKYSYEGPVMEFGRVIADKWYGSTFAPTEKKARCNLTYQFKKQYNKVSNAKITMPGELTRHR